MVETINAFSLLIKPIRRIIDERGFLSPTDPQSKAIPIILEGKNLLLIAPTGTGKTEAAFLPVFSMLFKNVRRRPGIKILYITPLRSLNRDLLDRLQWWCEKLDVRIGVRHGDTGTKERHLQSKIPPDMLITTPETLQAILPGRNFRRHLSSIQWVIVDEVHDLAENKRGSQLSVALERLRTLTRHDFQRIGLSATIGSPEKVAKFLTGTNREVEVVKVPVARSMRFQIVYPEVSEEDFSLATRLYTHPVVARRLKIIRELIEGHESVLLFTNTRSMAEILASRFRVWDSNIPISIHHGSLAKPARITAERGLKRGSLKGVICTSSLELGIDVGRIDLCIQYMSPRQVTRLVQRVGRSGHQIGRTAKGIIITIDSEDTLEAMVIAKMAQHEELEEVSIPEKPLEVLSHQIVGLLAMWNSWDFNQILELSRKSYSYRELKEDELIRVLNYMHTRYPRLIYVSLKDKIAMRPLEKKEMYNYYYENLSMIPYVKNYLIVDETNDRPIGILDEAFVAEYGKPGTKFIVRGIAWRITSIYDDKIYVSPVDDPTGAIPRWVGEEIPVPFKVSNEVGEIRSVVENRLKQRDTPENIAKFLSNKYPADKTTILRSIKETIEQTQMGTQIPTNKRVTIEGLKGYTIIQICLGSLANRTLAILIGHILSEKTGYPISIQEDPYRIIIKSDEVSNLKTIKETLFEISTINVKETLIQALAKTGLFKRRMIHVARRFGAISEGADFSNISLSQLIKSFQETVIFDEAIKETLSSDTDLQSLNHFLQRVVNGEVDVVIIENNKGITPIAKIGLQKIKSKSIISPEKMKRLAIESVKARILNEVRTFVCTNCWDFIQMTNILNLADPLICSKCGSNRIGILKSSEDEVRKICNKKGKLTVKEKWIEERAVKTAKVISKYGRSGALILMGKNLRLHSIMEVLKEAENENKDLFELIVKAERRALRERFV